MLEQEYLELCNELKIKYEKLEEKENQLNRDKENIIKVLTSLYGVIRIIKNIIAEYDDLPCILRHLINYLFNDVSKILFRNDIDFDILSIHSLEELIL